MASLLIALVALGAALAWREMPRWQVGGSAAAEADILPPIGDFPVMLEAGSTVAVEGDSLVKGSTGTGEGPSWPQRFGELAGIEPQIRAMGGANVQAGFGRFGKAACADATIIAFGSNDAATRGWLGNRRATPLDEFRTSLRAYVRTKKACGGTVILLAPPPVSSRAGQRRLASYRAAVREIAAAEGAYFHDPAGDLAGVDTPLQRDGLHLSAEGRSAIATGVAERFQVRN